MPNEDTLRLDCAERQRWSIFFNNRVGMWVVQQNGDVVQVIGKGKTIREALDQARSVNSVENLLQRRKDEAAFVEQTLGDSVICKRCGATLSTYADACSASLSYPCPGFLEIERVKKEFARKFDVT